MATPAISIVVPAYNLEFYVQRCIDSLLCQTLKDIEIVVVDDGSTDDTESLIAEYQPKDPRVRVHRKANGGHGSACNTGIELARGEYVMIVDGDDFLDPTTCEEMYNDAREHDVDLLMGNLRYHFAGGRRDVFRPLELSGASMIDGALRARLFAAWATPCGRIYRRSLFDDPDLRFLPGIIFADVNFSPKALYAARTIRYVDREFYNYDVTRPTQSMKQTDVRVLNVIPALNDMLAFYRRKDAFQRHEPELMQYTLRHVIAWIDKVRLLTGYPKDRAIAELFEVLDRNFEARWLGEPLHREVGPRKAALIQHARRLGYAPLSWTWTLHESAHRLDKRLEKGFQLPARGYQKIATWMKHAVVDRLTY